MLKIGQACTFLNQIQSAKIQVKDEGLPWFTNSEGALALDAAPWGARIWFDVLIDEMLPCDSMALLSMSQVLVVQKSSDIFGLVSFWLWILKPFVGSSSDLIDLGLRWHARKPLLCYNSHILLLQISFYCKEKKIIPQDWNCKHQFCISSYS